MVLILTAILSIYVFVLVEEAHIHNGGKYIVPFNDHLQYLSHRSRGANTNVMQVLMLSRKIHAKHLSTLKGTISGKASAGTATLLGWIWTMTIPWAWHTTLHLYSSKWMKTIGRVSMAQILGSVSQSIPCLSSVTRWAHSTEATTYNSMARSIRWVTLTISTTCTFLGWRSLKGTEMWRHMLTRMEGIRLESNHMTEKSTLNLRHKLSKAHSLWINTNQQREQSPIRTIKIFIQGDSI